MDVRCPRCSAEYDFDATRIPDEGVTVKCPECAHVFRLKKAALPPPPPSREWKVRQPGTGNTYTCRELTTLQKWIVEAKVSRDDEISLSGDTWKRLGNIPELASFFQVVDDAQKARTYEALRSVSSPDIKAVSGPEPLHQQLQPPPPPPPSIPQGQKSATETWREASFASPPPPPPPSVPGDSSQLPIEQRPTGPRRNPPPQMDTEEVDEAELERAVKGGGKGWIALVVLGLAAGGGMGWYLGVYAPEQQRLEQERAVAEKKAKEEAELAAIKQREEEAAKAKALAEAQAAAAAKADAGPPDAGPVDAGAPDAGVRDAGPPAKVERQDFDSLLARAEKLLESDKAEAALSLYGRAADLKPDRVEPIAGRGLAMLDMGMAPAAQASFEQALRTHPRYGPAIMGLAEAFRAQGKNEKAIEWYQRYLDVNPEGSEANVARNNIARLKK